MSVDPAGFAGDDVPEEPEHVKAVLRALPPPDDDDAGPEWMRDPDAPELASLRAEAETAAAERPWADEVEALTTPSDPAAAAYWTATLAAEAAAREAAGAAFRAGLEAERAERERPLTPEERAQLRLIESIGVLDRLGALPLSDVSTDPPAPLLVDLLDPEGHTIMYGTGGVGKGVLTAHVIVRLVEDGHRVLVVDYEDHPGEWARRVGSLGGSAAVAGVAWVAPLAASWKGARGAIWNQAGDLRELAEAWDATVVVVDSIVPAAAGSDPLEPRTPGLYAGALQYIGRPVLSLAHVTKDGGLAYPFGSVFWHNLARVTWSLSRDGERVQLVNRKANNYRMGGRYVVETTWRDDVPGEVWIRTYSAVLAERIDDVLGDEELTAAQVVAKLNADLGDGVERVREDTVAKALRRGLAARPSRPQRYTVSGTAATARYRRILP